MTRAGIVSLDGLRVGRILESGDGTEFAYDGAYVLQENVTPISLTMPVRTEPYRSRGLIPFFENLLPEGWLLELSTLKLKIPKDDAFGLLLATAADCIGAVEIVREDES